MPRGYRFLEHTSDIYIEAYGGDLEEAFEEAGKALYAVLVRNIEGVSPRGKRSVEASGIDTMALLYDWLERLLLLFEIERFIGSEISVGGISSSGGSYSLRAEVAGEEYDPARHSPGIAIKSPTYWLMEIGERDGESYVRFVLDI